MRKLKKKIIFEGIIFTAVIAGFGLSKKTDLFKEKSGSSKPSANIGMVAEWKWDGNRF